MQLLHRPRRLRTSLSIRELISENRINFSDLIYPVFIRDGVNIRESIGSMPNQFRFSVDKLVIEIEPYVKKGLKALAIFPLIDDSKKSLDAKEAFNPSSLVVYAIRELKKYFPDLLLIADIALDPYTTHGQDGLIDQSGYVLNDETVEVLVKQSLCYADAGVDILAPSDMMDGRILEMRKALEADGFIHTKILAYSAKYASCFYGPFRDAVGSAKALGKADKRTYQLDPANSLEALRECALDIEQGADIIMIKPAMSYLDIISKVKEKFSYPTFAYQVSGEYAMIHSAAANGWLDLESAAIESLISIKRAGADAILSYFTPYIFDRINK